MSITNYLNYYKYYHRLRMLNYVFQLEKWRILGAKDYFSSGVRELNKKYSSLKNSKYYLTFPSSNQLNKFNLSVREERPPVVILFGWAGGQDQHLKKYSEMYNNNGMITMRHFTPIRYLFWQRQHLLMVGNDVINLIAKHRLTKHSIFVHLFSNGGAFQYHGLSKANEQVSSLRVKGVIFDSAPGARLLGYYRAVPQMISGSRLIRYPFAWVAIPSMLLTAKLQELKSMYLKPDSINGSFEFLRQENNYCPQHFVYSKDDKFVYYEDIEEFIRVRNSLGVQTSFTRFDSSPHVQHMLYHKDEYVNNILQFINESLK